MSRLVALYPAAWRRRYEAEFLDLLAARPPGPRDRFDIVLGALDARFRPQLAGDRPGRLRVGYLPFLGLGAWALGLVVWLNGPLIQDEFGSYREGAAALPLFLLAVALLVIPLAGVVRDMAAGVGKLVASVGLVGAVLWSILPWVAPFGIAFVAGLLTIAAGAHRARVWPGWALPALAAVVAVPAVFFAATAFLPWYVLRDLGQDLAVAILASYAGIWIVVGGALLAGHDRGTHPAA